MDRKMIAAVAFAVVLLVGALVFFSREDKPRLALSRVEPPSLPADTRPESSSVEPERTPGAARPAATPSRQPATSAKPVPPAPVAAAPAPAFLSRKPGKDATLLPGMRELTAKLNDPNEPPERDLEIVEEVLSAYRRVMGAAPAGGENIEIVNGLVGENARKLAVMSAEQRLYNEQGELLDRWGTPFNFHPVSDDDIQVMSAGPDRKLWTSDDVGKFEPVDAAVGAR